MKKIHSSLGWSLCGGRYGLLLLTLLVLMSPLPSFAGAFDTGGGSQCEADYKLVFHRLMLQLGKYEIKLPKKVTPAFIIEQQKNAELKIVDKLLKKPGVPEWKMAWSSKPDNKIELYCLEEDTTRGWLSLSPSLKKVLVLHEALWWVKAIRDEDFQVSPRLMAELEEKMRSAPRAITIVGSSLYTEVFGKTKDMHRNNEIYRENIKKIFATVHRSVKGLAASPVFDFLSATISGGYVNYYFSHLYDKTAMDSCSVSLRFKKEVETSEVSDVRVTEYCENEEED